MDTWRNSSLPQERAENRHRFRLLSRLTRQPHALSFASWQPQRARSTKALAVAASSRGTADRYSVGAHPHRDAAAGLEMCALIESSPPASMIRCASCEIVVMCTMALVRTPAGSRSVPDTMIKWGDERSARESTHHGPRPRHRRPVRIVARRAQDRKPSSHSVPPKRPVARSRPGLESRAMSQSPASNIAWLRVKRAGIHDDLPLNYDQPCAHRDACAVRP